MWNDSEFNSTFASPGGNANKEAKKNQIKYIIPVTAAIINKSSQVDGENSIFDYQHMRFHHVCLVGIIRSVIKRSNDITYVLDDMTAPEVTVKLQADDNDDNEGDENMQPQSQFIENQYIKVYGLVKALNGQKYIQAFRILALNELNEITYHMLNCMNASISIAAKKNNDGSGYGGALHGGVGAGGGGGDTYSTAPTGSNPLKNSNLSGNDNGGLTGLLNQISSVIKQNKSSEGVHINDICAYFKNVPVHKIKETLDFLSSEGHIYSTTDDEHFRSTDAM